MRESRDERLKQTTVMNQTCVAAIFSTIALGAASATFEQPPARIGGSISDGLTTSVADDFQFVGNMLVEEITWWGGGNYREPVGPDNFTIRIFADDGGKPGELLRAIAAGEVEKFWTGTFQLPSIFPGYGLYPEFQYQVTLTPGFRAQSSTRYWLSIVNVPPPRDHWAWEVSTNTTMTDMVRTGVDPVAGPWDPYTYHLPFGAAFSIRAVPDSDNDGVPDAADRCSDTPAGAIINAQGCSIEQLVLCDGQWRSHGEYVSAVVKVTADFLRAGLITATQRRGIIHAAVKSDCGQKFRPRGSRF
jgi:hypothetical protein